MSRIMVLAGGQSTEHDVSLASGADVAAALAARHEVALATILPDGTWTLPGEPSPLTETAGLDALRSDDIVFPVLHGGWGENGGVQRELDARGIAYVGCRAEACETGMSKIATAGAAARRGVATIPTRVLRRWRFYADPDLVAGALARVAEWPLIVKPNTGGSSVGVHVVRRAAELRAALGDVFALDDTVLLQPLVTGAEVSVGVWRGADGALRATGASLVHLPVGEDAFTYDHKYQQAGGWLEIPASLPAPVLERLQTAALETAQAIGVEGLARVDFFVHDGNVVLNEINTMPGLRRESHFPRLVAAAGTVYEELLDGLIAHATVAASCSADACVRSR
ncbi:MAG: D-alanine--D-alanine ligase family protein [Actinomycetota bacterium]